jgi:hypothetical protein
MAIVFPCPNADCGKKLKVHEKMAGRSGRCPSCGHVVRVPESAPDANPEPAPLIAVAKIPDVSTLDDERQRPLTMLPWIACFVSIGAICLAATLPWVEILSGGISGLQGDGRILLGISLLVCTILGLSFGPLKRHRAAALITCLAWGTFCIAWMFSIIWTIACGFPDTDSTRDVGSTPDIGDAFANALAAAISTQVQPGFGLYVGAIGGVTLAAAAWWAWVTLPKRGTFAERFRVAFGAQALSLLVSMPLLIADLHIGSFLPARQGEANRDARHGVPMAPFTGWAQPSQEQLAKEEKTQAAERQSKLAYIKDYLVLSNIEGRYREGFGKGQATVSGKIRNTGSQTLNRVEVTAYLLDHRGKRVFEDTVYPVFVREYGSGAYNKPLKPGYIREFGLDCGQCPAEWKEGAVEVAITAIEFADPREANADVPHDHPFAAVTGRARPTQEQLAETEKMQAEEKEKQEKKKAAERQRKLDYIKNYLLLSDIEGRYQKQYGEFGPIGATVFGTVQNNGSQTLNTVAITAYFLDEKGKRVFEDTYHPVLVRESPFGNDNKPLKPGYIQKFGYQSRDCPSAWREGAVEVAITDIEFADAQK